MPEVDIVEGLTYPSIKGQSTPDVFAAQNKEDQGQERYQKVARAVYCINASNYRILPLLRQEIIQIAKSKEGVYSQS